MASYLIFQKQVSPKEAVIDAIEVYKSKREMIVFSEGKSLKVYKIALGKNPIGPKEFEGDCKTPEGIYIINDRNPNSAYHKNLGISYPDESDLRNAAKVGKPAGGDIKIHGLKNGKGWISKFHRLKDWTAGCIAVTNSEIDELFASVQPGAVIKIYP